ncbi:hypothetical protein FPOAC2_10721 [Fusarium poae]|jgi:hypothetical protein
MPRVPLTVILFAGLGLVDNVYGSQALQPRPPSLDSQVLVRLGPAGTWRTAAIVNACRLGMMAFPCDRWKRIRLVRWIAGRKKTLTAFTVFPLIISHCICTKLRSIMREPSLAIVNGSNTVCQVEAEWDVFAQVHTFLHPSDQVINQRGNDHGFVLSSGGALHLRENEQQPWQYTPRSFDCVHGF